MANTLTYILIASGLFGLVLSAATIREESPKQSSHRGNVLLSGKDLAGKVIKFPYYVSGYDYDGHPVIVMEWGRWDIRTLAENGGEDLKNFETSADHFIELIKNGYFNKKRSNNESDYDIDEDGGVVALIDFDGLNLRQIGTAQSMELLLRNFAKLEKVHGQFAYGFIVNANPLVHQVINLARPFMAKYLERTEVFGTNPRKFIPEILKKIPRSQLHSAYGGTKDFRPVAVYSLV